MSVIVIVQGNLIPEKAESFKHYQTVAFPIIQKYGGEIMARGSGVESLIGGDKYTVGAIIRFPSVEAVRSWHNDPEYKRVIPLRTEAYAKLEINVFQE
jgi:uncharacterized protein (DUF1330 family)